MKKIIIFVMIVLAAIAVIAYLFRGSIAAPASSSANSGLETRSIMVGTAKLTVEVAATSAETGARAFGSSVASSGRRHDLPNVAAVATAFLDAANAFSS